MPRVSSLRRTPARVTPNKKRPSLALPGLLPKQMSALYHCRDDDDDPDLQVYSRRISLRAPPPPNLVSMKAVASSYIMPDDDLPAPRIDDSARTRGRLAPAHRDVRDVAVSQVRGL